MDGAGPTTGGRPADGELLAAQLAEDYLARLHSGEQPSRDEYLQSHPEIADLLDRRLRLVEMLHSAGSDEEEGGQASRGNGSEPRLGARLGPYRLLDVLGEGGMGIVYHAEQLEPVRREVALKLVRSDRDTSEVLARFEAERQALALMDHPHVAHLHDAGRTDSGRPYFVMELVRGLPITEYCERKSLGLRARLELFATACDAVHHAHQKGVVHRDVKPSNLLVSERDGKAVLKVIDFGVAKATSRPLTERTLATELGRVLGTPEYMSPEQASLTGLEVDARSDVYSLGAMLYELLTGELPVKDARALRQEGLLKLCRRIVEEEPERPSRRTRDARRARQLAPELDWVVLKALEKEPERRYQTASELGGELRRWLRHEVVGARAPGFAMRLRKAVRRNRRGAVALMVLGLALGAGLLVVLAQLWNTSAHVRAAGEARTARRAELRRSEAMRLVAQSVARQEADPARALALAARAAEISNEAIALSALGAAWDAAPSDIVRLEQPAQQGRAFLAWSPDGLLIASGAPDGVLRVWSADEGELVAELGHQLEAGPLRSLEFSEDGKRLLTGHEDLRARVWSVDEKRLLLTLEGHAVREGGETHPEATHVWARHVPGRPRLLTYGRGGSVRLWDENDGRELLKIDGQEGNYHASADSTGRRLLIWNGAVVRIHATDTGELEAELPRVPGVHVRGAWFLPGGGRLLTAHAPSNAGAGGWQSVLRDAATLEPIHEFDGMAPGAASGGPIAGPHLLLGRRRSLVLVDLDQSYREHVLLEGGQQMLYAFDRDGRHLLVRSDGVLRCWDLSSMTPSAPLSGHRQGVDRIALSPDGARWLTASNDGELRIWEPRTGRERTTLPGHEHPIAMLFSPDGRRFASVDHVAGMTRLWDPETSALVHELPHLPLEPDQGASLSPFCGTFSPDGTLFATGSPYDCATRVWQVGTGRPLQVLHRDEAEVPCRVLDVAFSPDGRRLASACMVGLQAEIWAVETGELEATLTSPHSAEAGYEGLMFMWGAVGSSWSPDGRRLLTRLGDQVATIWDAESWEPLVQLVGHSDRLWQAEWLPDGRSVLTRAKDSTVRLWDAETGHELRRFERRRLKAAPLSPDGEVVALVAGDVHLMDVSSGRLVRTLGNSNERAVQGRFSADGRWFATLRESTPPRLDVWEVATGRRAASYETTESSSMSMSFGFSPDGSLVPLVQGGRDVRLLPTDLVQAAREHPIVANARFDVPVFLE